MGFTWWRFYIHTQTHPHRLYLEILYTYISVLSWSTRVVSPSQTSVLPWGEVLQPLSPFPPKIFVNIWIFINIYIYRYLVNDIFINQTKSTRDQRLEFERDVNFSGVSERSKELTRDPTINKVSTVKERTVRGCVTSEKTTRVYTLFSPLSSDEFPWSTWIGLTHFPRYTWVTSLWESPISSRFNFVFHNTDTFYLTPLLSLVTSLLPGQIEWGW